MHNNFLAWGDLGDGGYDDALPVGGIHMDKPREKAQAQVEDPTCIIFMDSVGWSW